jgi:hypothetical protein
VHRTPPTSDEQPPRATLGAASLNKRASRSTPTRTVATDEEQLRSLTELLLDEVSSLTGCLALGVVVLAARDPHCVRESEH